ncbi:MAG: hypothetical protein BWK72_03325 [Rhodoferax ferrireducens]|uniref:Uncharacterized protein n=1 Tax=Rhodoferax ferrireducens TaxID=192843 RepID=A0A1W9KWJ8_9BURK|nr:MAG: hypothetical protein BWK72_03325 [Rhodoferax ferrireducens]
MITFASPPHCWSTASNGLVVDTSAGELLALGEHLGHCQSSHRHLQSLRCAAHSVRGFVAARLVTTVLLPAVVLGMTLWLV